MFDFRACVMFKDRSAESGVSYWQVQVEPVGDPPPADGAPGNPPWQLLPPLVATFSFQTSYEAISDVGSGPTHWNHVAHYKRSANRASGTVHGRTNYGYYWTTYNPPSLPTTHSWEWGVQADSAVCWLSENFGPPDAPFRGQPVLFTIQNEAVIIPPPDDLDVLLLHASQRLLPGVKSELSLINSIYELKDFKSLGRTFNNISSLIDSASRTVSSLTGLSFKQYASNKTIRQLVRKKSDIYLQYKFNISPLVSDIQGVLKSLRTFQSAAKRQVSKSAQRQRRHAVISIPSDQPSEWESDSAHAFDFVNAPASITTTPNRLVVLDPAKFHVEIEYNFHYTQWQKQHAALLTFLDKLGVNFDPAIIWNAIPYSFLVDWVVRIGPYLSQWKTTNMEPVINISNSLWSIHRERRITCTVDDSLGRKGVPVSFVREEAYRRSPFILTPHLIESSGLSLTEVSLAGALLGSRR